MVGPRIGRARRVNEEPLYRVSPIQGGQLASSSSALSVGHRRARGPILSPLPGRGSACCRRGRALATSGARRPKPGGCCKLAGGWLRAERIIQARPFGSPVVRGLGCLVEQVECGVESLLTAPVRLVVGFGR